MLVVSTVYAGASPDDITGKIKPAYLLFHLQKGIYRVFLLFRNGVALPLRFGAGKGAKQVHLPVQVSPCVILYAFQNALQRLQAGAPA